MTHFLIKYKFKKLNKTHFCRSPGPTWRQVSIFSLILSLVSSCLPLFPKKLFFIFMFSFFILVFLCILYLTSYLFSCRFQKHTLLQQTVWAGYVLAFRDTWDFSVFPVETESQAGNQGEASLTEISKAPLCLKESSKPYRSFMTSEHKCQCAPKNFTTEWAAGDGRLPPGHGFIPQPLFALSLI